MPHQVLLFYKYVTIEDPKQVADTMRASAEKLNLKGRILVAEEGINATVEGLTEDTEKFAEEILLDSRFSDIRVKRSVGNGNAFPKLSVKVRNQIVGTKISHEEADPRVRTAPRLTPEELRSWYEKGEDFVVVDMRNDYEFKSGHFKNSVNPELQNSRDLPKALPKLEPLKKKKVLTVCTGGVRCESMSAYLLNKGFEEVYQLEDGIHAYMEKYPGKDFLGTLYTFDKRTTMHFGGERQIVGVCVSCGASSERYVDCKEPVCKGQFIACVPCAPEDRSLSCPSCVSVLAV